MTRHVDGIHELADDAAKAYLRDIGTVVKGEKEDRLVALQKYLERHSISSYTPKGRRNGVGKEATEGKDGREC